MSVVRWWEGLSLRPVQVGAESPVTVAVCAALCWSGSEKQPGWFGRPAGQPAQRVKRRLLEETKWNPSDFTTWKLRYLPDHESQYLKINQRMSGWTNPPAGHHLDFLQCFWLSPLCSAVLEPNLKHNKIHFYWDMKSAKRCDEGVTKGIKGRRV